MAVAINSYNMKQSLIIALLLLLAILQGAGAQEEYLSEYIDLYDGDFNSGIIEKYDGQPVTTATLVWRTLLADGNWNTLCLPFDLTIQGSILNNAMSGNDMMLDV